MKQARCLQEAFGTCVPEIVSEHRVDVEPMNSSDAPNTCLPPIIILPNLARHRPEGHGAMSLQWSAILGRIARDNS